MTRRDGIIWALLVCLHIAGMASSASAVEKVINITGNGSDAQYIEQGKTKQLNVVVKVGDTVVWKNNPGNKTHTATSDVNVDGKPLFTTGNIAAGATSAPILFNQAMYDAAVKATGGKAGERVHLGYFCEKHPSLMGGKLVLEPVGFRAKDDEDHKK